MARIIYFTRDYTPHDHRFLSALARTDHEVYYLQLERRGHALEDRPLPAQIERIQWAGGQREVGWRQGLRLLPELKRVIRRVKPDLVQAGPIQRSAFLVALSGFRPFVSMSWGYDLLVDADRNALWRSATRFTLQRSAAMVGDCDTIRQLAAGYGLADERIITFPWGIDLKHFNPRSPFNQLGDQSGRPYNNLQPSTFTLLSTRGWEGIYGVEVIARAFVLAARQRPELRLIMLGNGSQAAALRQIFLQGGVEEQVLFPGQVRQGDLPRYYHMANLYLSASHSDGTSISLLEAMACELPALVSDIPGNREWVQPGVNGWLFPDGDETALSRAIVDAADQPQRVAGMGQAAREIAEQRADWEQNFPMLLKAYAIALGS